MAAGLLGIDEDKAVLAAIHRPVGDGVHALGVIAHATKRRRVVNRNYGHPPALLLVNLAPKLARHRLRRGNRAPVVVAMLVFAGDLAVEAPVAAVQIDNDRFHMFHSPILY